MKIHKIDTLVFFNNNFKIKNLAIFVKFDAFSRRNGYLIYLQKKTL